MSDLKTPLISVIIPTFNCRELIEPSLKALLNQSFRNFEVLVIDNASTDGTTDILDQYSKEDPRIKIFSKKDKGIYDAMNNGIYTAAGQWIYFLGADDKLYSYDTFLEISDELKKDIDLLYGDVLWMPEKIKEQGEWGYETFLDRNINHQRIFYRRDLFQKFGPYNLKYKIAADHELNIRMFCNNDIRKRYIPVTIAKYHSGGFSSGKTDEVFWENWETIVLPNFRQHLPEKTIYKSLGTYCRHLIDKKNYKLAFKKIGSVFTHTYSLGFLQLMAVHFAKSIFLSRGK